MFLEPLINTQGKLLLDSDANPLRTHVLSELMSEPDHGSAL